jgi:hypothetical protein
MKYSELKAKIKILKKHGYRKAFGLAYVKEYRLNQWTYHQAISYNDLCHCNWDFEDLVVNLYEKNMRTLFEYLLEQEKIRREY